jgi:hypothetical protein
MEAQRTATVTEGQRAIREATQFPEPLSSRLTPQQTSLIRAVILGQPGYLEHSGHREADSGRRTTLPIEPRELDRFTAMWSEEPIDCIRLINCAVALLEEPGRFWRYLEAAVDLEIAMDRRVRELSPDRVQCGIPRYLMDGYTDMGLNPSNTERRNREKIRVDKEHLRARLIRSKCRAVASPGTKELLAGFYEDVRRDLAFDYSGVNHLSMESGAESVDFARYLDEGVGVCRHLSLAYQLFLQEAAIAARVVKGRLRLFGIQGRHAWNVVWFDRRVALVDVTIPNREGPLILYGASQEEVYRMARDCDRCYSPTPDKQNFYKIGDLKH